MKANNIGYVYICGFKLLMETDSILIRQTNLKFNLLDVVQVC